MARTAQLYISPSLISQLRAAAEVLSMDSAESVAELWLSERLEKEPAIMDRDRLLSTARREAVKTWEAKWIKPEEQLP